MSKTNRLLEIGFWITAILILLGYLEYFLTPLETGYLSYDLHFIMPSDANTYIKMVLRIVPCILFAMYLHKGSSKIKSVLLIPISFCILAAKELFSLFSNITEETYSSKSIFFTLFLVRLLQCVFFILIVVSVLKRGKIKKGLIIAASILPLFFFTVNLFSFLFSDSSMSLQNSLKLAEVVSEIYLYFILPEFADNVGNLLFVILLLCFELKINIPAIMPAVKKIDPDAQPEKMLKILKDRAELGLITEEKYQAEKSEIINSL